MYHYFQTEIYLRENVSVSPERTVPWVESSVEPVGVEPPGAVGVKRVTDRSRESDVNPESESTGRDRPRVEGVDEHLSDKSEYRNCGYVAHESVITRHDEINVWMWIFFETGEVRPDSDSQDC